MESRPPTQPGHRLFYLDRERFAAWVGRPFVVQIRPVRLEDAPELARILTGALRDTFAGRVPEACLDSPTREESERNWRRSIEKPGFCEKPGFLNDEGEFLLVAEDMAGQMAGFILAGRVVEEEGEFRELWQNQGLRPGKVVRELTVLMVDPDWQRKGIGRLLVEQVTAVCQAQNTQAILVGVHIQNPNNAFYHHLGARHVLTRPHDWAGYKAELLFYLWDDLDRLNV
jgi:GNAT superfamily N-acetyltransferase